MQGVLLRRVLPLIGPAVSHFEGFLLRIKVAALSDAISLSVALKRPERSFGGTTDSRASSFTDGSTRVYISVVCVFAWPSHSATFRRSFVACRTVKAQVCLRTCGCTRFVASEGQCCFAVRMCLRRMYSKPERVKDSPRALTNSSGTGGGSPHCQPGSERRSGCLPQRQAPFPAALAMDEHAGLRLELQIVQAEADQFGDA